MKRKSSGHSECRLSGTFHITNNILSSACFLQQILFVKTGTEEAADGRGVCLRIVEICPRMLGTFRHIHCLRSRLGVVERAKHGVRHEGVGVAVDEEHRQTAPRHLRKWRSLAERPTVTEFAKQARRMHQRKRRQRKLPAQLKRELVPHTRISTVFDKGTD